MGQMGTRSVYAAHPYLLQIQGGGESDWALAAPTWKSANSCGRTATDQDPRTPSKSVQLPEALGTNGAVALGPEPEPWGWSHDWGAATGDPLRGGMNRRCV